MISQTVSKTDKVRDLNDAFRRTFVGGAVVITSGIEAIAVDQRQSILAKVRSFDTFTADNDPHGEHDFGVVEESCGSRSHHPAVVERSDGGTSE
jgi:hypothetical protein